MSDTPDLTPSEIADSRLRRITAMGLQSIEGNPLSDDQVAMFEMFEREGWSHERRRRFIRSRYAEGRDAIAAE